MHSRKHIIINCIYYLKDHSKCIKRSFKPILAINATNNFSSIHRSGLNGDSQFRGIRQFSSNNYKCESHHPNNTNTNSNNNKVTAYKHSNHNHSNAKTSEIKRQLSLKATPKHQYLPSYHNQNHHDQNSDANNCHHHPQLLDCPAQFNKISASEQQTVEDEHGYQDRRQPIKASAETIPITHQDDNLKQEQSKVENNLDIESCPHFSGTYGQNPLPFEAIPGPKPSIPFIGTNWIYFPIVGYYQSMKLHEANLDKYYRYGPIMKEEYQRGYPSVTIFDPKDVKEVFMREGTCPSRPVLPYVIRHRQSDPSRYPNVGLANMMGQEWLELRSQLAPLLLSKELKKRHIGSQNKVSTRLVSYIRNLLPSTSANVSSPDECSGLVPNIQEVFYRFSMESIMNLCINQELGCLDANGKNFNTVMNDGELIFQAAMNFFEAQHKLYYGGSLWKFFDTKPYRQLRDSQNAIHDIASKYIDFALGHLKHKRGSISASQSSSDEHESLLETLCSTNKFSDLEIKSTIVDFVGGGIYTVANTLTMALFLLASNPSVQEQLYQEICHVFPTSNNISYDNDSYYDNDSNSYNSSNNNIDNNNEDINIDMDKLDQLKFLKLCLKESYRLLPTIPGIARTLQRDTVLSNYVVPKNTLVFCNFMVTCRLPQYFEDPDSYNPSRWERNGKTKGDLAFCLLPFGHGVRKCIGHNFAELEIYVAIAKLIRNFKVSTINGENAQTLDLSYKFIVVPEKPVTLKFTPRKTLM